MWWPQMSFSPPQNPGWKTSIYGKIYTHIILTNNKTNKQSRQTDQTVCTTNQPTETQLYSAICWKQITSALILTLHWPVTCALYCNRSICHVLLDTIPPSLCLMSPLSTFINLSHQKSCCNEHHLFSQHVPVTSTYPLNHQVHQFQPK